MAATVAHSQQTLSPGGPASNGGGGGGGGASGGGGGLHPLMAAAAANAAKQQQQQSQQRINARDQEPFDLTSKKLSLADFSRVRTLGTGTFARVCLVRPSHGTEADRSKVYALKILRKTEVIKLKQIDHVRHERQILSDVSGHPFITSFQASFSDHDFLYILLDYIPGGELFTYLRKYRRFDEDMARFYAAEIVLVLEYLHEHQGGIAYRDMKPENLLLDAEGHIKLVDFGFAKRLGNNENDHPEETYTLCGTPEYLAPEVIHNKGHTTAVDWWALGILIYEFLTGYPPFWHSNPIEIYKQIVEKPVVFPQDPPISPEAKDIIRQFCTVDRSRRLGNISGGAARVKAHPFFKGVDWDAVLARKYKGPILPPVRYPGDAQCFDIYPEEDDRKEEYTGEMAEKYDEYFKDF
ncbi:cytochrome c oxidase subunit 1 [Podospora pseudoanserina]|uniref:cAMP-dependent protein kinase n=1 Tax=Podospora pseudoanserina TaxID=2609844 RepID=A0ABR0ISC4_9PEZI|nr:cytochrome c oxidase subunit 1 [Podospora pseudoanserina]